MLANSQWRAFIARWQHWTCCTTMLFSTGTSRILTPPSHMFCQLMINFKPSILKMDIYSSIKVSYTDPLEAIFYVSPGLEISPPPPSSSSFIQSSDVAAFCQTTDFFLNQKYSFLGFSWKGKKNILPSRSISKDGKNSSNTFLECRFQPKFFKRFFSWTRAFSD